jgi:hypothetical protein
MKNYSIFFRFKGLDFSFRKNISCKTLIVNVLQNEVEIVVWDNIFRPIYHKLLLISFQNNNLQQYKDNL